MDRLWTWLTAVYQTVMPRNVRAKTLEIRRKTTRTILAVSSPDSSSKSPLYHWPPSPTINSGFIPTAPHPLLPRNLLSYLWYPSWGRGQLQESSSCYFCLVFPKTNFNFSEPFLNVKLKYKDIYKNMLWKTFLGWKNQSWTGVTRRKKWFHGLMWIKNRFFTLIGWF